MELFKEGNFHVASKPILGREDVEKTSRGSWKNIARKTQRHREGKYNRTELLCRAANLSAYRVLYNNLIEQCRRLKT